MTRTRRDALKLVERRSDLAEKAPEVNIKLVFVRSVN